MFDTEKVIQNLVKLSNEKKALLTNRHEADIAWLAGEISKIKLLVKPSGFTVEKAIDKPVAEKTVDKVVASEPMTSMEVKVEETKRQKRKSPDEAIGCVRSSPDQKRNSSDYEQLAINAGLPADLNKLKKEQLLSEIQARRETELTLKSLKKELVDTLKDLLIEENKKGISSEEQLVQKSIPSSPIINKPESLSDFSAEIPATAIGVAGEVPVEVAKAVIEQNVPDIRSELEIPVEKHSSAVVTIPEEEVIAEIPIVPEIIVDEQITEVINAISEATVSVTEAKEAEAVAEIWQEVASPMVPSTPQPIITTAAPLDTHVDSDDDDESVNEHSIDTLVSVAATPAVVTPIAVTEPVAALADDIVKEAVMAKPSPVVQGSIVAAKLNALKTLQAQQATVPPVKKPVNLVSMNAGQTSLTEKPKPVIAALAQAAKLREQEEIKAIQKKIAAQPPIPSSIAAIPTAPTPHTTHTTSTSGIQASSGMSLKAHVHANAASTAATQPKMQQISKPPIPAQSHHIPASSNMKKFVPSASAVSQQSDPSPAHTTEAPAASAAAESTSTVASIFGFLNPFSRSTPSTPNVAATPVQKTPVKVVTPVVHKMPTPASAKIVKASPKVEKIEEERQYEMDNASDSDSGTDDEKEDEKKEGKFIPDWARNANLKEALARQYGVAPGSTPVDPDTIFSDFQTCDLAEIFGKAEGKFGKYARRTSSAKWDLDELTIVEKRKYRAAMGLANTTN